MYEYIKEFLKTNEVEFLENKSLRSISAVKIGGNAAIVSYPKDESEFSSLIVFLKGCGVTFAVLGRMSNVLPPDDGYDRVIIKTDKMSHFTIKDNIITASSGVSLPRLAHSACSCGISGFEELSGIPGSVGGAIAGNAGAFGREISDVLIEASVYDPETLECYTLNRPELRFGYRTSLLKNANCYVLSAKFKGLRADESCIKLRENEFVSRRKATQPHLYPSLGSVFKKTADGISAGYLIDKCGLKGYRFGDAQISEIHAGFIVNRGKASAKEYVACMDKASRGVKERFGIDLEKEIVIL